MALQRRHHSVHPVLEVCMLRVEALGERSLGVRGGAQRLDATRDARQLSCRMVRQLAGSCGECQNARQLRTHVVGEMVALPTAAAQQRRMDERV